MSFELLDFVNDLIIKDLLESSAEDIVKTTQPDKLPSKELVQSLLSFTRSELAISRSQRLADVKERYLNHKKDKENE